MDWQEKKASVSAMALVVCAEIILGIGLHHKYTYRFNELIGVEVRLAEQIGEAEAGAPLIYLYGSEIPYIDIIQFQLPKQEIQVLMEAEVEEIAVSDGRPVVVGRDGGRTEFSGYVLLDSESFYRQQMDSYRRPCAESSYFALYDWRE